jgi:hypothetical protein
MLSAKVEKVIRFNGLQSQGIVLFFYIRMFTVLLRLFNPCSSSGSFANGFPGQVTGLDFVSQSCKVLHRDFRENKFGRL